MCGIVAVISAYSNGFSSEEQKAFTDMLFVDTMRGWDSTGVFSVSTCNEVNIVKGALEGPDFIRSPEYREFNQNLWNDGIIAVGHNRAATRGVVNDKNSHPFWINDNTVLVQNGSWNGSHKEVLDSEVDTEAIAYLVDKHENDLDEAFKQINAAFALVWYNVKSKKLHVVRNTERPLWIGYEKNGTVLIASERSTILYACMRQGLELREAPYELADSKLNIWELDLATKSTDFECQNIKLDYPFQYRHTSFYSQSYFHQMDRPTVHTGGLEDKRPFIALTHSPSIQQGSSNAKDYHALVTLNIGALIQNGSFPDHEYTEEIAKDLHADFLIRDKFKRLVVEFTDYIKANYSKNSLAYYIVGRPLVTSDSLPNALIYTLIVGKTEMEILDIVTRQFYSVSMSTARIENVTKNNKNIVAVFVSDLKPAMESINALAA